MSSVAGVQAAATYAAYQTAAKPNTKAAEAEKETEKNSSDGVVYDKTPSDSSEKATYSINKMSAEKRAELVKKMKADQASKQNQLTSIVQKMPSQQAGTYKKASGDDIWQFLAKGGYSVDEMARKEAQELIADDGYYGVEQTSQRIFDFASALAGDDPEKMEEMRAAFEKGFQQATKSWGSKLPDISQKTRDAVNKLFDDYAASKKTVTETETE